MRFEKIVILFLILNVALPLAAQSTRTTMSSVPRPELFFNRPRPTREQRRQLEASTEDKTRFEQFLKQPKTGMFRLFNDLGCNDNAQIVRADAVCLGVIPDSSYYSFREKEHTLDFLADIRLRNGFLVTDGALSQSVLVTIGDVPLEKVTFSGDGLEYLQDFRAEPLSTNAQKQFIALSRGVRVGKFEFRKAVQVAENTTYGLRIIAYRANIYRRYRGFLYDLLEGDKRIDMTIAFRIVRREKDGTLTILWREFARDDAPRLVAPPRPERRRPR